MQISIKSRYGLRAMVYLTKTKKVCSAKEISQKEKIPFDFLEKIFSKLQQKKLVKSQKGPAGGYYLAKPPQKINIKAIIKALEENKEIFPIFCKKKHCPSKKKCPIKNVWKKIKKDLDSTLEKITLIDLCQQPKTKLQKKRHCLKF